MIFVSIGVGLRVCGWAYDWGTWGYGPLGLWQRLGPFGVAI